MHNQLTIFYSKLGRLYFNTGRCRKQVENKKRQADRKRLVWTSSSLIAGRISQPPYLGLNYVEVRRLSTASRWIYFRGVRRGTNSPWAGLPPLRSWVLVKAKRQCPRFAFQHSWALSVSTRIYIKEKKRQWEEEANAVSWCCRDT